MKRRILLLMMTALLSVGAWAQSLQTVTLFEGSQVVSDGHPLVLDKTKLKGARVGSELVVTINAASAGTNIPLKDSPWTSAWANQGDTKVSFLLPDHIISDINSESTPVQLLYNNNNYTVTKVTLSYNGVNLLSSESGIGPNIWDGAQQLKKGLFAYATEGDVLSVNVSAISNNGWKKMILTSGQGNPEDMDDAVDVYNDTPSETEIALSANSFTDIVVGSYIRFTTTTGGIEAKSSGTTLASNLYWNEISFYVTDENISTIKDNGITVTVTTTESNTLIVAKQNPKDGTPTGYWRTGDLTVGEKVNIPLTSALLGHAREGEGDGNLYLSGYNYSTTSVDLIYKSDVNIAGGITNGTVTTDKTKALEGETVTLTVTPDGNYELGTLTVTDATGAAVSTSGSNGTYSFTMPATAVTVDATFTHNDNLTLSTGKILCFNSTGGRVTDQRYYTDKHELWVDDGEHNGWDLTIGRIATTEEFSGVTINFKETQNIQLEIAYNDGSDKTYTQDLSSATSPVVITFSEAGISGVLKSIMFARKVSNTSKIAFTDEESVTMQIVSGATYPTPRTSMTLTYETLEDTGNSSVTYDRTNKTFTIKGGDNAHWAFWDFILPLPTSLYNGINFNLTQAPAGSKIEIIYDGDSDHPQQVEITSETTYNVDFNKTGNVTRIRFAGAGEYKMGTCTAKPAKYQVTVSAAQYATFGDLYSPDVIDYSSASGLKAYIAYVEGNKVKLEEVSKATANTAVILYANVEEATPYTVNTTEESASTTVHANELHISDGTVTGNESGTIYVLADGDNGVGFYRVKNASAITAGKAYLEVTSSAPQFIGFGGDTTGINEELRVKSEEFATAQYYDLQGRHVAQPTKGLYIVNGKKVIIK